MTDWDGAYLLGVFKDKVRLPTANEYSDNTDLYPRASRAQVKVFKKIAGIFPDALYSAPFALTPSTDRKTFTFGTDSGGNPQMPLGWVQLTPNLKGFTPGIFFVPLPESLYIDEATQIRITSDRPYSGTIYCRCVLTPPNITASVPPALQPAEARELIAIQMAMDWARDGNGPSNLLQLANDDWKSRWPTDMLAWKRRYRHGGAGYDPTRWWFSAPSIAGGTTT